MGVTRDEEDEIAVLLLFGHPALERSRVNSALLAAARGVAGVTIHDLYEAYPEFDIDVPREQSLLLEHDLVVMQHPLLWYSTPAIIKEWQDLVLEHGWAYGSKGTALHGKRLLSVVSTGGGEDSYGSGGHNHFTLRQLLAPIEQTARLCGMGYSPPFAVHGVYLMSTSAIEEHARDYARLLAAARDDRVNWDSADRLSRINADLDAVIGKRTDAR